MKEVLNEGLIITLIAFQPKKERVVAEYSALPIEMTNCGTLCKGGCRSGCKTGCRGTNKAGGRKN